MRLALLTDLHANREALEACLAHAAKQGVDQYAFTGDFVGYGADPSWVVGTVMDYVGHGAIAVQGNRDLAVTRATSREPGRPQMHAQARQVIEWTRGQLDPGQLAFLAALSLTRQHGHAFFVHALALYRRADDGRMARHLPSAGQRIPLQPQHRYLVLPGVVGQPRDQNNAACYALFDDDARAIAFFRVPYDHGAAARKVIAAGLPIVLAMRLVEGL